MEVSAMEAMLSNFALIGTAVWTQVTTISQTITEDPLMFFTTGFLFIGGCVGIFGRLLSRN